MLHLGEKPLQPARQDTGRQLARFTVCDQTSFTPGSNPTVKYLHAEMWLAFVFPGMCAESSLSGSDHS